MSVLPKLPVLRVMSGAILLSLVALLCALGGSPLPVWAGFTVTPTPTSTPTPTPTSTPTPTPTSTPTPAPTNTPVPPPPATPLPQISLVTPTVTPYPILPQSGGSEPRLAIWLFVVVVGASFIVSALRSR